MSKEPLRNLRSNMALIRFCRFCDEHEIAFEVNRIGDLVCLRHFSPKRTQVDFQHTTIRFGSYCALDAVEAFWRDQKMEQPPKTKG